MMAEIRKETMDRGGDVVNDVDNKPCILLVDDKPANLLSLEALLEDFDAKLLWANSGEEALRILLRKDIALILLDIQMPGMDGFEVAELIRKSGHNRHVPIIFITAISRDMEHLLRGYQCGAVDYLTKPIEPLVLQSKVRTFFDLDIKTRELEAANKALSDALTVQKRLREQNEMLLRSIGEGIVSLDVTGRILYLNPVGDAMLDHGELLLDLCFSHCVANTDSKELIEDMIQTCRDGRVWYGTVAIRRYDDSFPAELVASPCLDGQRQFAGISLVIKDISHWQLREQELRDASERDALTGLLNRSGLNRLLSDRLCRASPDAALLFLDLDHFKPVNDQYGHQTGDQVLREVSQRLRCYIRDSDAVARVGGDEFCILIQARAPETVAATVAEKLLQMFSLPISVRDRQFQVGGSIGIAPLRANMSAAAVMDAADTAMYAAKSAGRNCYHVHERALKDPV